MTIAEEGEEGDGRRDEGKKNVEQRIDDMEHRVSDLLRSASDINAQFAARRRGGFPSRDSLQPRSSHSTDQRHSDPTDERSKSFEETAGETAHEENTRRKTDVQPERQSGGGSLLADWSSVMSMKSGDQLRDRFQSVVVTGKMFSLIKVLTSLQRGVEMIDMDEEDLDELQTLQVHRSGGPIGLLDGGKSQQLARELEEEKTRRTEAEKELAETQNRLVQLQSEMEEIRTSTLIKELRRVGAENDELTEQLERTEVVLGDFAQRDVGLEEEVASLRRTIAALKKRRHSNRSLRRESAASSGGYEAEWDSMVEEIGFLRREGERLKEENANLRTQLSRQDRASRSSEDEIAKMSLDNLERQKSQLMRENERLKQQVTDLQESLDKMSGHDDGAVKDLEQMALNATLPPAVKRADSQQKIEMRRMQSRLLGLQSNLIDLEKAKHALEERNRLLQKEKDEVTALLHARNQRNMTIFGDRTSITRLSLSDGANLDRQLLRADVTPRASRESRPESQGGNDRQNVSPSSAAPAVPRLPLAPKSLSDELSSALQDDSAASADDPVVPSPREPLNALINRDLWRAASAELPRRSRDDDEVELILRENLRSVTSENLDLKRRIQHLEGTLRGITRGRQKDKAINKLQRLKEEIVPVGVVGNRLTKRSPPQSTGRRKTVTLIEDESSKAGRRASRPKPSPLRLNSHRPSTTSSPDPLANSRSPTTPDSQSDRRRASSVYGAMTPGRPSGSMAATPRFVAQMEKMQDLIKEIVSQRPDIFGAISPSLALGGTGDRDMLHSMMLNSSNSEDSSSENISPRNLYFDDLANATGDTLRRQMHRIEELEREIDALREENRQLRENHGEGRHVRIVVNRRGSNDAAAPGGGIIRTPTFDGAGSHQSAPLSILSCHSRAAAGAGGKTQTPPQLESLHTLQQHIQQMKTSLRRLEHLGGDFDQAMQELDRAMVMNEPPRRAHKSAPPPSKPQPQGEARGCLVIKSPPLIIRYADTDHRYAYPRSFLCILCLPVPHFAG
ncbi:unnamed protein product [Vitrella brassicaformis CCMP3155]|uniref:Uncharacterized protein n=1 Tax=Vitrella brassicaformis (strain CCMP3155) TaxID=1169540 RepID=A0A0G4EHH3_VITBC|nr:unnamed protein product [Vitrella brassicaformis CCMP3155]|eukprot:CEL95630.1 unnamed protein product [Vitrella brassicaformis CCMP3155]